MFMYRMNPGHSFHRTKSPITILAGGGHKFPHQLTTPDIRSPIQLLSRTKDLRVILPLIYGIHNVLKPYRWSPWFLLFGSPRCQSVKVTFRELGYPHTQSFSTSMSLAPNQKSISVETVTNTNNNKII